MKSVLEAQAVGDVLAERQRQVEVEGWTPEHDDQHEVGELATAAACYAGNAGGYVWAGGWPGEVWPWAREWWKPSTPRRDLVKAAALIIAEIERLDRAAAQECPDHRPIIQHTGDGTPVEFCPECGRNEVAK